MVWKWNNPFGSNKELTRILYGDSAAEDDELEYVEDDDDVEVEYDDEYEEDDDAELYTPNEEPEETEEQEK